MITGLAALPDGRSALAVSVAGPPVEGAANAALIDCVAKHLGVSKSCVTIASGATSRIKLVDIAGDPHAIADRLGAALGIKT